MTRPTATHWAAYAIEIITDAATGKHHVVHDRLGTFPTYAEALAHAASMVDLTGAYGCTVQLERSAP